MLDYNNESLGIPKYSSVCTVCALCDQYADSLCKGLLDWSEASCINKKRPEKHMELISAGQFCEVFGVRK